MAVLFVVLLAPLLLVAIGRLELALQLSLIRGCLAGGVLRLLRHERYDFLQHVP